MFGLSIRTSMQNLDSVAQKMSYAQFSIWLLRLVPTAAAVTNLRIELRALRQLIKIFLRILSETVQ